MKVVLFCGGLGLRIRDADERIPKPMVMVGSRPILWHVMKYYAHFGHNEFILCLGYRSEVIKSYFLGYDETVSNDFVITKGGRHVELLASDIDDWRITFVDTGLRANVGERLRAVRRHLKEEELFMANYGDVLTDAPLPQLVETFRNSGKIAGMLCVRPNYSFHLVSVDDDHTVRGIQDVVRSDLWINGGYFEFRQEIFDYIRDGEDLVAEPFERLVADRRLLAHRYDGFWAPMDTLKDKTNLEAMIESGITPWRLWAKGKSTDAERST